MRTIPLYGKKAAGRVALVDDGDYELVMQYAWRVYERAASSRYRAAGPYAMTTWWDSEQKRYSNTQMHILIMGFKGIDHIDHDGLNNQRYNLRPATQSQNNMNQRPQVGRSSQYKGVFLAKESGLWRAVINCDRRRYCLGDFANELEAAYAYDAAAREHFGEYAYPNFPEGPTQVMRDQWGAETEARLARIAAMFAREQSTRSSALWESKAYRTGICVVCGEEFQTKAIKERIYCGSACGQRARYWRRARELEAEREQRQGGRLF